MTTNKDVTVAQAVPGHGAMVSLSNMDSMMTMATTLQQYIRERGLTSKIQGREYVNVEAWQFAGAQLGLFPQAGDAIRLDGEQGEIKYGCSVNIINYTTGATVGKGYAICSNKESSKKGFAEYAIASMAQTRAIGKAYRNLLAWVMKAAGFEATPAEEMDTFMQSLENLRIEFCDRASKCNNNDELQMLADSYPELGPITAMVKYWTEKKKALTA